MAKGNFYHNYPKVIKFLEDNDVTYHQFDAEGQHLRIMGHTAIIDFWPSRMKYHIVESEDAKRTGYYSLSYYFNEKEFKKLIETGKA